MNNPETLATLGMNNPETLATLGTHDTGRRQTRQINVRENGRGNQE